MAANMFLMFVAVGIGVGAIAYGFGGVYILICGISFAALGWGAIIAMSERDEDLHQLKPARVPSRVPSQIR